MQKIAESNGEYVTGHAMSGFYLYKERKSPGIAGRCNTGVWQNKNK